jgi:fucose permease
MDYNNNRIPVLAAGFAGMTFFGVAFVIMGAVLPSLIDKFSLDTSSASTLAGVLPLGILLGSILFGPVIDRFGYKSLIIISSILTIAGLELLAFSESTLHARIAVFVIGTGGGILNGLTNALVSDVSKDNNRASNLSILGVFYTVGAIAMPLLFATLSKSLPYNTIVARAGIFMAIPVILYLFVSFPKAKYSQGIPLKKIYALLKEPFLIIMSFTLFFQSGLEGISNNWIPTFLEEQSGADRESAMFSLTTIILGMGAGRLLLGFLLRKISNRIVLATSMALSAAGMLMVVFSSTPLLSLTGTFIMGFGYASTFPVILGELGEKYREMSGTAFSIALVIALTGNTLLNLLVGVVTLNYFHLMVIACTIIIITLYSISYSLKK